MERCRSRPIAHVAAETGISRACAQKWVNRHRRYGELGLHDRSSTPRQSPNATPAWVLEKIETWRRENKWSVSRIIHELAEQGFRINRRTVTRHLTLLGLGNRRFLDHTGDGNRTHRKIVATLAEEVLYARPYDSEDERSAAIGVWSIHYNYHRPHSAVGGQPPATRLRTSVTNVQPSSN